MADYVELEPIASVQRRCPNDKCVHRAVCVFYVNEVKNDERLFYLPPVYCLSEGNELLLFCGGRQDGE